MFTSLEEIEEEEREPLSIWMDQDGKTSPLRAVSAVYDSIRLSPDGTRVAVEITDRQPDIWIYEWARDTLRRFTFDLSSTAVWTPDGSRIAFRSKRAGGDNLYWQRADGTGEVQRLTESQNPQFPMSWHPGGKFLAFQEHQPQTRWDILILPIDGSESSGWKPGKPTAFLADHSDETEAAFSPDGRWFAYVSDEPPYLKMGHVLK